MVAVSDECWRRVVVYNSDDESRFIASIGHHGTGNGVEDMCAPRGLEFLTAGYLWVIEDHNHRIKRLYVYDDGTIVMDGSPWDSGFNNPHDLDVAWAEAGDVKVVVADTDNNRIYAFCDGGCLPAQSHYSADGCGNFLRPISVAFGRDQVTSEKNHSVYFIDGGNQRLIKLPDVFSPPAGAVVYDGFDDPETILSAVSADNKGLVWVVDRGLGRLYRFTSDLELLAIHGVVGTEDGRYLLPTDISCTHASEYLGDSVVAIAGFGEMALSEKWGTETGMRRLVAG